jgi:acyl transferase domain-containing protein/NAD(P)-dependent dehydrogenase (short-subunit alcohol dehydrogenase family)/acyl carrier protein
MIMESTTHKAIAIVGLGAVLPDAPNVAKFWDNVKQGRYSITDVSPDRWDQALYYDADPSAPDKAYSKIGGWVREFSWEPLKWHLAIPPRVVDAMDEAQKWAIACTREALQDYGYPERPLDLDRTAVIFGNAMAGEKHYLTSLRIFFPEYDRRLADGAAFRSLPESVRGAIRQELHEHITHHLPEVTEDSMPGELANCLAGRVANVFNFHGANFTTDAACASAMAAITAAVEGLVEGQFDAAITGGIDRNMGAPTFVKFCKIGALSATGTRPYAEGADGFVMGEGAAIFLLKRLADAERDGDKIYAVLRGIGASSDGKGKGITAPNPLGQKFAIERAWDDAGLSPATATLIEGHGTSTRVGDVVEVESMAGVLEKFHLPAGSVALGSVKSNIGHLKGAAGAAGVLKTTLALHEKVLPPSAHFERPNPDIDFAHCPLYVNTELRPWNTPDGQPRRAGVSAFGFGGTNFHVVLEEYIPHRLTGNGKRSVAAKAPLRGALVLGAVSPEALAERLRGIETAAKAGQAPERIAPAETDLRAPERLAIDYGDAAELADKAGKALKAFAGPPAAWKALRAQGIFRGSGPAPKVAFLYTGQGSQYINMLQSLRASEPVVAATFAEADQVMTPLLGKPLSDLIFVDGANSGAIAKAEDDLRQTAITQPAVLAVDLALTRLFSAYGITPDMTMGHSLGEYGALVAADALPFVDALEAVSARGREMTRVAMADNGRMAAIFAPLQEIERIVKTVDGYVVIANINSNRQAVIGGASKAVEQAIALFDRAGYNAVPLPVSHAFHTSIVAPAAEPLRRMLARLRLTPPRLPVVANLNGEFYPMGSDAAPRLLDILGTQIASPVQFVKGLRTLYAAGARVYVEVGPKKALQGFAEDVLGDNPDVVSLFTNHPKQDDVLAFNQALCGLYAAGLGKGIPDAARPEEFDSRPMEFPGITITGAALGLPGTERIFDDSNLARILHGDQFIDVIPTRMRRAMLDKHITRLVKSDNGNASFETLTNVGEMIKLAGRGGAFDPEREFGVPAERLAALDRVTQLAIGVGIDALRDAGIPLVLRYKTTSKGTKLPDRWLLPEAMRDDTGVVFASAFPGYGAYADEMKRYYLDRARREQVTMLENLASRINGANGISILSQEIERQIAELRAAIEQEPYVFDRRFIFRILSMGHSQFAEFIGARGPNTAINAACASTTQAVSVAEDWIRSGRCRRVIIISADDITSDQLMEWLGAGFLASGAAATDDVVEEVAVPFDRRRHGMICGMGAAALLVESKEAARERGIAPICEVLSAVAANSAFHGTRLDVEHISQVMEELVAQAESRYGISRQQIAPQTVFVSHETYTPARGGSASAEIHALRRVFGEAADQIVITNTKGFTGHAMGAGIEEVVAVKALETGCVPPVANFKEVDPELGPLNLSKGGLYPVKYALRLGAGFGSQIGMALLRLTRAEGSARPGPRSLGYSYRIADPEAWNAWLTRVAGRPAAELEVVQRTLRVRDQGGAAQLVAVSTSQPRRVEVPTAATLSPAPLPASAAVAAPPPVPAPTAPSPALDPVKERILELMVEKTGYPRDMLDLDLDLEADLGIDTVKKAEMFAAIREIYGIPRDQNLKLSDFPTLNRTIQFVYERRPDLVAAPVAAASPLPVAAAFAVTATVPAVDSITERVLDIVAEKTGYPKDMLDLDLDLEADLGIDTVKQAEMFASVRAAFGIARDANLRLRDFPTLAHVIQFAKERQPQAAPPTAAVGVPAAAPQPGTIEAASPVPRRVPVPVLRPPLALCKPTGVTLGAGSRVVLMPDRGGVTTELANRLARMGCEVLRMNAATDIEAWLAAGPIHGVYWLPALDHEGDFQALDQTAWHEAVERRLKSLYAVMRTLSEPGAFLVSATRLGGQHGYDDAGAVAPLGGAVTGFTKAYKWERPEALAKAVDFERLKPPAEIAQALIDETLRDPGAVEIGYKAGERWTIVLEERPASGGLPGLHLGKETVFLITGAAGSIVSAITTDLAAASGGTFYLLDLVPEPAEDDPDLKRFVSDREGLKRELFGRLQAHGERGTPAAIERELAALERAQAARAAIDAVRRAGGQAHYFSVDLTDATAVARVIEEVRKRSGRIDVLLHAAGMERSHFLPDKDRREFDLIFDVKAGGWFNLLRAIGDMPLKTAVAFSSIAARFGNRGQTDYSAANDLLCKLISSFRTTRPATRGIAIDWTAWAGIGMASRGSIPKTMEQVGIEMLPPEAGIPIVRRELTEGGSGGEVLIAKSLGALRGEWDATGGLDTGKLSSAGPMFGKTVGMSLANGLTVETLLDPTAEPFLHDHQIDGTPVLPGVMGVEAFAEAALAIFPAWHVQAVENVDLAVPFKFYRQEPRTVTIHAQFHAEGDEIVADCRLTGSRTLPHQTALEVTTHFTGRVRLSRQAPQAETSTANFELNGMLAEAPNIYRVYFHGPAYQVLERVSTENDRTVGLMAEGLPVNDTSGHPLAAAPRLLELCFQTAGLWQMLAEHRMGLPAHIDRISVLRAAESAEGRRLYAVVTAHSHAGVFDAEVVDGAGNRFVTMTGYRTVALPDPINLDPLLALEPAHA